MKKVTSYLIALLSIVSLNALASDTGYTVELIIFEDTQSRYMFSEDWSFNDSRNKKAMGEVDNSAIIKRRKDKHFKMLDWKGAELADELEKLSSNSTYRVIYSQRWRQTGRSRDEVISIPIDTTPASADPAQAKAFITGQVKLIMSRYLHFNVDLEYHRNIVDQDTLEVASKVFPVISERRMRSREVHYIDHPLIGIIVLATPFDISDKKPAEVVKEYKTL